MKEIYKLLNDLEHEVRYGGMEEDNLIEIIHVLRVRVQNLKLK